MTKLYGSLEAGGTKFVCAVGDENYNVTGVKHKENRTNVLFKVDTNICLDYNSHIAKISSS